MAEAKAKSGLPDLVEVESNHNSLTPPKPVGVARLAEVPDYNPMRRKPNKANVQSDTTHVRETADELVDTKGDRPYRANVEFDAETVAETSAAPDAVKAGAIKSSPVAAAEPNAYRDRLPADVSSEATPAEDSGLAA